jgi:inosine-uridine nucleoside N-ribohydrolase
LAEIHLDTDLGGDIDDLCALAMVLNWPGVEICGVTTVAEHGGKRAGYVRYALGLAGRNDIPVVAGADADLGCFNPWPALPDESRYWPEPIAAMPASMDDALSLLERNIDRGATIVAIGPYTNLAMLEQRTPGILQRAKLFLMGGHPFPAPQGFPDRGGETDYNIQADARSGYLVLEHSSPTLVPLPITVQTALRRADLVSLSAAGPLAQLIARQAEAYAMDEKYEQRYGKNFAGLPDDIINFQHDPLACAIALDWSDGVEIHELPVVSTFEGGLVIQIIADGGRLTKVVTKVDGSRFADVWLEKVTST